MLLLDEPFGALDALDPRTAAGRAAPPLARRPGRTALFITHSVEEAVYLGSRVVVMSPRPGRIIADIPVPFATPRPDRALRADPTFLALRERVAALVMADGDANFQIVGLYSV